MSKPLKKPGDFDEAATEFQKSNSADDAEYEVGYKKPPKQHQFKPGNKHGKGKPKGSKNTKTIVNEALGVKVPAKVGGKTKKLTKFELAIHQLANKASQGDLKAIEKAIQLQERYGPQEDPEGPPKEKLQKDLSSLKKYLAMKDYLNTDDEEGDDD